MFLAGAPLLRGVALESTTRRAKKGSLWICLPWQADSLAKDLAVFCFFFLGGGWLGRTWKNSVRLFAMETSLENCSHFPVSVSFWGIASFCASIRIMRTTRTPFSECSRHFFWRGEVSLLSSLAASNEP